LEAIKLIESGLSGRCDEVWVVSCPREQQLARLTQDRGLEESEALARIDAQGPQSEKLAAADVVIDNSGDLEGTRAQVAAQWQRIQARQSAREPGTTDPTSGGSMSAWLKFMDEHPRLSMWIILAVGMVAIFLVTSRDVELLPTQRLFMALACVGLAGLCSWIIHWE
jgi:hypothetical protein